MIKNLSAYIIFVLSASMALSAFSQKNAYYFIENKGQWPASVLYRADLPGGKLFLQENKLTYAFYNSEKVARSHHHINNHGSNAKAIVKPEDNLIEMHALDVEFINSKKALISADQKRKEYYNYFTGTTNASHAAAYEAVKFENIYENVNYKLHTQSGGLKYDLEVLPNGNPSDIQLKYQGSEEIALRNGNLYIKTSLNTVIEQAPYAYQLINNDTLKVECNFQLKKGVLGFSFPNGYNKREKLIIDPLLIFSTFSGSIADNWGFTATYGENGTLYSGGIVFDFRFPVSTGAYQTTFGGNIDIGIIKFDSVGSEIIWASMLGGIEAEVPHSLIINNKEELLILGTTSSLDYPVTVTSFDQSFNGGSFIEPIGDEGGITYSNGSDIIISKLNSSGTNLLSSTFIGGSNNDGVLTRTGPLTKNYGDQFRGEIIIDSNDNVYVSTNTSSLNIPVINGFQNTFNGGSNDGYIFKMDPNLSDIIWSSYLGGSNADAAFSIKIDNYMNAYVVGGTTSANFPTTISSINPSFQGNVDGFVSKISSDGSSILNSTYIGTDNYDQTYFLDIDDEQNIYLYGQTQGAYPITEGVYSSLNGGQFIHKLNNDLSETIFSTVFGSSNNGIVSPNISPTAFLASGCHNIYVAGWGGPINDDVGYVGGSTLGLPVTADAFQKTTNGSDFYLMVLSKNADALLYATFFGGDEALEHVDGGTSRFNKAGVVYHVVCAGCWGNSSFTTTPNAYSTQNNSLKCNMAAFKFDLSAVNASFEVDQNLICLPPYTVKIKNTSSQAVKYLWDFGDGSTSTDPKVTSHSYSSPGDYTITLSASNTEDCGNNTATYSVKIKVRATDFKVGPGTSICQGDTYQLSASGGNKYSWTPTSGLNNSGIANPIAKPDSTTNYIVTIMDANNCTYIDSVFVEVFKEVKLEFETEFTFSCTERPVFQFNNKTENATSYVWDFGDGATSTEESPTHSYQKDSVYEVKLLAMNQLCSETTTISLPVTTLKVPNVFTPNSDNRNDFFEVKSQAPLKLRVFNRWGKEVYFNEEYKNEWNAADLPSGTYFYSLEDKKDNMCKGWVDVLR